jgi:hypothetical protein
MYDHTPVAKFLWKICAPLKPKTELCTALVTNIVRKSLEQAMSLAKMIVAVAFVFCDVRICTRDQS